MGIASRPLHRYDHARRKMIDRLTNAYKIKLDNVNKTLVYQMTL
jgi:hypothetical protein